MWSVVGGTIVNVIAVAGGSIAGLSFAAKLPSRYRDIVLNVLGMITLTLGVDAAVLRFADTARRFGTLVHAEQTYGARLAMVMIASLLIGAILGTFLRLQDRIEGLGAWLHRRFSAGDGQGFAQAFLTASVIFCVGPMTLLGCLQNGARGDPGLLYIKSLLDGFCAIALSSSLGWGVAASILTVAGFQGGLSVLAYWVAQPLDELSIALMTIVGGVALLATGFLLLDIKRMPVANLLPAVFLPPLFVWLVERVSPGLLLPSALAGA